MEFPDDFTDKKYGKGSLLLPTRFYPIQIFRGPWFVCNHDEQGVVWFGHQPHCHVERSELFSHIDTLKAYNAKVYVGGPVSQSAVFFLCRSFTKIEELEEICTGVYLGSNLETLEAVYPTIENPEQNIRFYMGYSGWAGGQLAGGNGAKKLAHTGCRGKICFIGQEDMVWPEVVSSLGEK